MKSNEEALKDDDMLFFDVSTEEILCVVSYVSISFRVDLVQAIKKD